MRLVSRQNDGSAIGSGGNGPGEKVGQQLDDLVGAADVEVREWLVEQKQLGVGLEHAGQRGALAHALRVLPDRPGQFGVQADCTQRHLRRADAVAGAVQGGEVDEVLHGRKLVVEHGRVRHVGDTTAALRWGCAEDVQRSLGRLGQTGEQAQQGGLAGAVFAQDDRRCAGGKRKGCGAQGGEAAKELGGAGQLHGRWGSFGGHGSLCEYKSRSERA